MMKLLLSRRSGFTLLEVLISTVVLSIGLLGIAALQSQAIRYNHSAQLRAIAISQASSMIDRMQANASGVNSGAYNNVSGIGSLPNCTTCTNTQIAQRDIYLWNTSNSQLLPSGQGTITRNGDQFTMVIRWDNQRTGARGTGCSGKPQIDLTCLIMEIEL